MGTLSPPGRPIPDAELGHYAPRRFVRGWRLCHHSPGRSIALNLLLDAEFPFSVPRVALVDPPPPLTWPHVEDDGLLCLAPDGTAVSTERPQDSVEVVRWVIDDADRLMGDLVRTGLEDHFLDEFASYWTRGGETPGKEFRSLLTLTPGSREIAVWRGEYYHLVADSPESCDTWLSHLGGHTRSTGRSIDKAAYVWLKRPPYPREYPRRAGGVGRLVDALSTDGRKVLEGMLRSCPEDLLIVFGAEWKGESILAGVQLRKPKSYVSPGGRKVDRMEAGFRHGRAPASLIAARYLGAATAPPRSRVVRVDGKWLHGKDRNASWERLRESRVCVIGCGSLGAGVARLLAQAGVASLDLVDDDHLDWPNTSRHALGAGSVGQAKADALARALLSDFPHLRAVRPWVSRWQDLAYPPALLGEANVIVSATGDWNSDSALSDLQRDEPSLPPIVFGWLEAHAAAAHGVLLDQGGPCLRCGFDPAGNPLCPVSAWPAAAPLPDGDCGGPFSPYGATELAFGQAAIARLVVDAVTGGVHAPLHHVWIANRDLVDRSGGKWSAAWCAEHGDPGEGGGVRTVEWPTRGSCSRHEVAS